MIQSSGVNYVSLDISFGEGELIFLLSLRLFGKDDQSDISMLRFLAKMHNLHGITFC